MPDWFRRRDRDAVRELACGQDHFSVLADGVEHVRVAYSDILSVTAYKVDMITTDTVCFQVRTGVPPHSVIVTEEDKGFTALDASLADVLHGYDVAWRDKVHSPPFAPCETIIHRQREPRRPPSESVRA